MDRMKRIYLRVGFWIVAAFLFFQLRQFGFERVELNDNVIWLTWSNILFMSIFGGTVFGLAYHYLDRYFDSKPKRQQTFFSVVIQKLLFATIFLFIATFFTYLLNGLLITNFSKDAIVQSALTALDICWSEQQFMIFLWVAICIFQFNFFKIMNRSFGRGRWWNILLGRYHEPKAERRIFMFLDLKSSTAISEQLGHIKFSEFIQDFFEDLQHAVAAHNAEIYKYMGDGVALTWNVEFDRNKNNSCIEFFFHFENILAKRRAYYLERYNWMPRIKAGIHAGLVMVAEVGSINNEIAYHGETVNLVDQIESQCNKYNQRLLISHEVLRKVDIDALHFKCNFIEETSLKNAQKFITLYAIEQPWTIDSRNQQVNIKAS